MLTDTVIKGIKAEGKARKYADGRGLYLYVSLTGSKLWRMDYRFGGKRKLLSFGEYPLITLKMARERRDEAKRLLAAGRDPSEIRRRARAAGQEGGSDFELVAREWHASQTLDYTEENRRRKLKVLEKHCFPAFGSKGVGEIEIRDILEVLKALEARNRIDLAHRVKEYTGMVLRYAVATGRAEHNVASLLKHAIRPRHPEHRASITDPAKIGAMLLAIDSFGGLAQTRCALRLMALFFVRSEELRLARWAEFDLEERIWRIPAERMKMRKPHLVPLADQAVAILGELSGITGQREHVFASAKNPGRPISKSTMIHALRYMGYRPETMCVHGFRSMASTILNEKGYNRDWIERQLAHQEKNATRAAYNYAQYLKQRRGMMREWADYLDSLKEGARAAIKPAGQETGA